MNISVNSRIAQLSKTGIPYYITELYKELQLPRFNNDYSFLQTDDSLKIGKSLVTKSRLYKAIPQLFDLIGCQGILRNRKVDIFHGPAHILPLFKRKGVKYVVTVHDLAFMYYPHFYPRSFNLYYHFAMRRSLKNADKVIAVSDSTRTDLIKFYPQYVSKIKTVYNGINDYYFEPPTLTRRLIEKPYFLSVTTHPQRKNIFSVLQAFAKSETLKQNYTFVIVGLLKGERGEAIEREITRLGLQGKVSLFGYATEADLKLLYEQASFFIYPSFYEGFGFPILEAMACGCPVIASSTSSMIELMPNKKWLIDPNDINAIKYSMESMAAITTKEKETLVILNKKFARRFTWSRSAIEMQKVFKNLSKGDNNAN